MRSCLERSVSRRDAARGLHLVEPGVDRRGEPRLHHPRVARSGERVGIAVRDAVKRQRTREQPRTLAQLEAEYVTEILTATKGNKSNAARILGISRKNLYERLARKTKDEG